MSPHIRSATYDDAAAIAVIYNHYIRESIATFEEQEIDDATLRSRMDSVFGSSLPWLVAEHDGAILGYAYATRWKDRSAYRFSTESTVYLDHRHTGKGVGRILMQTLLAILASRSIHAVNAGISLPNDASVALHEKLGFINVAHFKDVGFKFGRWIDVGYWQVLL